MSRMAVRKERLGGTGFGSADQPEHWAWTDRRRLMDSDALSPKVMGWDQRFWASSDQMRQAQRRCPERHWPGYRWLER